MEEEKKTDWHFAKAKISLATAAMVDSKLFDAQTGDSTSLFSVTKNVRLKNPLPRQVYIGYLIQFAYTEGLMIFGFVAQVNELVMQTVEIACVHA